LRIFTLQNKVDNHLMPKLSALILLFALTLPASAAPQKPSPPADLTANSPWLLVGFKGNAEDGVYYAISLDGYHWTIANQDRPVFHQTSPNELMRDTFLQRGPDGTFHMVGPGPGAAPPSSATPPPPTSSTGPPTSNSTS
jgi:hypothetical protein